MADSLNKLWLKGQAEEDIYIAKLEREAKEAKMKKKKKSNKEIEAGMNKMKGSR